MKYRVFTLLAAVIVSACVASPASAEEPLNIVFFGNSFTSRYGIPDIVGILAAADGHPAPTITADCENGQDLDFHAFQAAYASQNNVDHPSFGGESVDFVVMQGHSTEATHLSTDDFLGDMTSFYNDVQSVASGNGQGVTAVMYQTWARLDLVPGTYATASAMQAEITASYASAATAIDAEPGTTGDQTRIAAVGQSWEQAGFDASLYDSVGYHMSHKGAVASAMVLYRTLYDEDVSDIPASAYGLLGEAEWNDAAAIADAAPIVVPEPMTLMLLGAATPVLMRLRRKR